MSQTEFKANEVYKVDMQIIRENDIALRSVNTETASFQGIVESIKAKGFIGTITGRAKTDKATNEQYIEITDGLQRYTAAKIAGLKEIPVMINNMDDEQVLETQIMLNLHRVETKPVEYSKQLHRLLGANPLMTLGELSAKLGCTEPWLKQRLSLTKLPDAIGQLVDETAICLANAYILAKMPEEEMQNWIEAAQVQPPAQFVPDATARIKEIRDAKRKGKDAAPSEYTPVAHLRKLADLKQEDVEGKAITALITDLGITDPIEAGRVALKWALQLDPMSVEVNKAEFDAKRAKREAEKAARAEKRKADKEAAAAAKADNALAAEGK